MNKVLYIVEDTTSAQFRYQVKNVFDTVKNGNYEINWIKNAEIKQKPQEINDANLIVISRQAAKDNTLIKVINEARKKNKKVLFALDDLIFDYRDIPILMSSTGSKNIFYWLGYFNGVRRIAKRIDGFLVTNVFLGEKVKRSFGLPYRVIRNSLNEEQVEVAERCVSEKNEKISGEKNNKKGGDRKKGDEESSDKKGGGGGRKKFKIGYFSGSPTHERDLRVVEPEIIEFLEKHDDAELEVVGYMKFSERMRAMINEGKVRVKPLVDYRELMRLMAGVDVNIAPLVINDFTNCKSELKFFEAGVVETTTIASPTYTFRKAIKDGENGFLAQPGEWYDKLEYLYRHPEENRRIAKKAREYALKYYYGKEFLKEVEGAYDYFAD